MSFAAMEAEMERLINLLRSAEMLAEDLGLEQIRERLGELYVETIEWKETHE